MKIQATSSPAIDYLKQFPYWVCQGADKVPINPKTGYTAKSNDPDTQGTFEQCKNYWLRNKDRIDDLLMCFVITKETGLVAIDLDAKPNPVFFDDQLTGWAYKVVKKINSYTEFSRSGTGLHILAFGEIERSLGAKKEHGFEIYNHNKIWTITGKHLPFTPNTIERRQDEITEVYNQYAPKYEPKPIRNYQYSDSVPSTSQIEEMLSFIPLPIGYDDWLNICMAVHSVYPNEEGFNLVLNWSSDSFKEGENPTLSMRNKWRSFKGNGVGIGTLFHFAKIYGWLPPPITERPVQIQEPLNKPLEPRETTENTPKPEIVQITHDEYTEALKREYWRGYHDGMTDAQIQKLTSFGIPEFVIHDRQLGFKAELIDEDTGEVQSECLSIPYFEAGISCNVEYRHLDNNKVTYEVPERPALYSVTDDKPVNHVCLFDDSLDSIKAWLHYGTVEVGGDRLQFMALPKTKIDVNSLKILSDANNIYVVVGKNVSVHGRGLELLKNHARFVRLPLQTSEICSHVKDKDFVSLLRSGIKW